MDLSPKQEFTELTETQRNETKIHVTLTFLIIICAPLILSCALLT